MAVEKCLWNGRVSWITAQASWIAKEIDAYEATLRDLCQLQSSIKVIYSFKPVTGPHRSLYEVKIVLNSIFSTLQVDTTIFMNDWILIIFSLKPQSLYVPRFATKNISINMKYVNLNILFIYCVYH